MESDRSGRDTSCGRIGAREHFAPHVSQSFQNHRPPSRAHLAPGIILDARRAVWLEEKRILAVADLHLGYAWAHRHSGQLLPITAREDSVERLATLVTDYCPEELVLLGDIVHRAVPVQTLEAELRELFSVIGDRTRLRLVAGNHDKGLDALLKRCKLRAELVVSHDCGPHLLIHGDNKDAAIAADQLALVRSRNGQIFMGHEHPAIRVGDGVASMKCPCFLVSSRLIILPAFSSWAAGSNVRSQTFLSPLAASVRFETAHAILGNKMLPIALP